MAHDVITPFSLRTWTSNENRRSVALSRCESRMLCARAYLGYLSEMLNLHVTKKSEKVMFRCSGVYVDSLDAYLRRCLCRAKRRRFPSRFRIRPRT